MTPESAPRSVRVADKGPPDEVVRAELRVAMADALVPLSLSVAAIFVVFGVFNVVDMADGVWQPMLAHDVCVSAFSFWIWRSAKAGRLGVDRTYWASSALALLTASNVLLAEALTESPFYTSYICVIGISTAALMLSSRWVAAVLSVIALGWFGVTATLLSGKPLAHYTFAVFAAFAMALVIHTARRRSHWRMVSLRHSDAKNRAALEEALAVARDAWARLDTEVAQRTAELTASNAQLRTSLQDRDEAERRRKQAEQNLLHAQKLEAIGRLAGGIAHDFNNLLTVVKGNVELARQAVDDPVEVLELLDELRGPTARATELTSQLLTYGRRRKLNVEVIDMRVVIDDVEKMIRRLCGENVALVYEVEDRPMPAHVDRGQMDQVLMNLSINAVDAMAAGGQLTITLTREKSEDSASDSEFVRIVVQDTGTGIEPEELATIFEPFYTTKPVGRGTGLGLAIVDALVRDHKGQLNVSSIVGVGTRFWLDFPLADPVAAVADAAPASVEDLQVGEGLVLVTEDQAAVRRFTTRILRKGGFTVLEAADGAQALAVAQAETRRIDVLVTDVRMPGMDGRVLAEKMRLSRPEVGVLFMSGYSADHLEDVDLSSDHVAYLAKPFESDALVSAVVSVARQASRGSR